MYEKKKMSRVSQKSKNHAIYSGYLVETAKSA